MQCLHGMPGHSGLPAGLQPPRTAVQHGVRSLQQDYLVWLVILNVAIITLYIYTQLYTFIFTTQIQTLRKKSNLSFASGERSKNLQPAHLLPFNPDLVNINYAAGCNY